MPSYGDFNKDTKDLLTKNYADKGAWKVESKNKGPEKTIIFNPSAASGKPIAMDVEYNMKPFKTKTNITETGIVKPKITFEQKPHKVESSVTYNTKDGSTNFDANYEFKNDMVIANAKYDKKSNAIEHQNSVSVGHGVTIGSGVTYHIKGADLANNWNFGVHYAAKGIAASFTTAAMKSWVVGASAPVTCPITKKKFTAGAQIDNKMNWMVGGEGPCFNCPGAKLRVRTNQDFVVSVAWINKVAGGWKAAVGGELKGKNFAWGTTFTYE